MPPSSTRSAPYFEDDDLGLADPPASARRERPRAAPPPPPAPRSSGGAAIGLGWVAALLWAGGVAAYFLGAYGLETLQGLPLEQQLLFGFLITGPAVLFLVLGLAAAQLARMGRLASSIERAAHRLTVPGALLEDDAAALADAITEQIDRLDRAAEAALARLGAMEEVLRHHAESVNAATGDARARVDDLIEDLRRERAAIADLSANLTEEARRISSTIDRQAELVASAADLAASHASEGRKLLEQSAERLGAASTAAQTSGERAAVAIGEQLRDMEALVAALDVRASRLEAVADAQAQNLKIAQNTAHELTLAADAGAGAMRAASEAAVEHARRLASVIESELAGAVERGGDEIARLRAGSGSGLGSGLGAPSGSSSSAARASAAPPPRAESRTRSAGGSNGLGDDDGLRRLANAETAQAASRTPRSGASGGADDSWRWKDLLHNLDAPPSGAAAGDAVLIGLRRAGVEPGEALDTDLTARIARARRRAGAGEARALVLDGAMSSVRRTAAALAADPMLRASAEEFMALHARLIARSIDANDTDMLAELLDCAEGRAFLLLDAALSDV